MIRVVVADDEPIARKGLVRLLREDPGVEVVGAAADGREALSLLRERRPDLVFLDVQMPDLDGIAVAEELRRLEPAPLVIFVTAFDDYAVRAFELNACDYLLKPFERDRLRDALARAKRHLRRAALADLDRGTTSLLRMLAERGRGGEGKPASGALPERLVVRSSGNVVFLTPHEIQSIESAGNYVRIQTAERSHLVRDTLTGVAERLDPTRFVRIGRSALVNLSFVREVRPRPNGTHVVVLRDGRRLEASRRSGERLREAIARLE